MRFAKLLSCVYHACGSGERIEQFLATWFATYYEAIGTQPSNSTARNIVRELEPPPRRLLSFYQDSDHPRCPQDLWKDVAALVDCCFPDGMRMRALRGCLAEYLDALEPLEREDLMEALRLEDPVQTLTCLTWYAICGDHDDGTTAY